MTSLRVSTFSSVNGASELVRNRVRNKVSSLRDSTLLLTLLLYILAIKLRFGYFQRLLKNEAKSCVGCIVNICNVFYDYTIDWFGFK